MIPDELKELTQWCVWRYEKRNGKETKIPYDPKTYQNAKSNDESTWADYQTAQTAFQESNADGLGFFFKPPYMGIDLDDVGIEVERFKNDDHTDNIISEFYHGLKSYGEISPSGEGIHIILKSKLPGSTKRKGNVEMYDGGRFFTMTGDSLGSYSTINNPDQDALQDLYHKYIEPPKKQSNVIHHKFQISTIKDLSESEIINRILNSQQGDTFRKLMNGDWKNEYESQSQADMALANILAFWCAKDFNKMDSIFRKTGLMRPKWDEKRGKTTYGVATLNKAINETRDVYQPKEDTQQDMKYDMSAMTGDKKTYPPRSWDDTGNAERYVDRFGDITRYSFIHKKYYVYDGKHWKYDNMGSVKRLVDATVEDLKNEIIRVPEDMDEEKARKAFYKFIKTSRGTQRKEAIKKEIQHRVPVATNTFDRDDMLFNAQNGYIDLSSGNLHNHDSELFFSKIANFDYTEKEMADTWLDFLNDIFNDDQETIDYIQKALGYSLTGSNKEQVMFILYGKGNNGKSLFIETVAEILGDYSQNIQADSLMVKKMGSSSANNDIAALQGARMVTSSEPNEGFRFDEGLIKQLTGGDKVTARFLYGEVFDYTPKFKLWVSTNHKPIIRGTDDGIWRRLILVPFDVQIPKNKVDKNLKDKLLREAPAILNWIVEGAVRWQQEGLEPPKRISTASKEYRKDMDVLEHFIDDCCYREEDGIAKASELYEEYKDWADETNEYKMNKNKFGQKMKEKFDWKKDRKGIFYLGIVLKEKYPGLAGIR